MRATCLCFVVVLALLSIFCPVTPRAQSSVYGDANADGIIDVGDVVYLINYLFRSGPEPNPVFIGDANGDDLVDIGDVVYLVNYLYKSGPSPKNFYILPDSTEIVYDSATDIWFVANRVIVHFESHTTSEQIDSIANSLEGVIVGEIRELKEFDLLVSDVSSALEQLQASEFVDFAVRHGLGKSTQLTPNDTLYIAGQKHCYLQMRAPLAWEISYSAPDVLIGILDTGVETLPYHPDLESNIQMVLPPLSQDLEGHGTFVCGIVGAEGDNILLVSGLCWNCNLVSYNVMLVPGAHDPWKISKAIMFMDALGSALSKHVVINMSFEFSLGLGLAIWPAIQIATAHGDILIASAGNNSRLLDKDSPDCLFHPACFSEVLTVGSPDRIDSVPSPNGQSNWGSDVIAAPDGHVSTWISGGYAVGWGTSGSAALVTGLASLIWSIDPTLESQEVLDIIRNAADKDIFAYPEFFGLGRINAYRALKLVSDGINPPENKFPGRPTWSNPPGVAGDGYVALYWQAPSTDYDGTGVANDLTGYYIYRKLHGEDVGGWELVRWAGVSPTRIMDNSVSNGETYDYQISAIDLEGQEGYWTREEKSFTPTPDYHYITGFVRDSGGYPIPGVVVTVSGGASESYTTGDDGYYEFMHLPHGLDYTVTPYKSGWRFDPPSRSYEPLVSNQDFQNFTGTLTPYYYIKGYVRDSFGTGVSGITVTLSGAASDEYVTGPNGYYEFIDLEGGLDYCVTPSKTDCFYSPATRCYTPLNSDQDNQDFIETCYYDISGVVRDTGGTAMESVWVELSGGDTAYYLTDNTGYYEFLDLVGLLDYTVTPSKEDWLFDPTSRSYTPLSSNQHNQDFTATEIQTRFYIKGYVRDSYSAPMESVTVTLSGGMSDTYITGVDGYYEFLELPGGLDYTVTPSKPAYGFTPPSRSYTPLNSDQDNQDFTGTLCPLYDITGYVLDTVGVGISDVVVHLTGAAVDSYTTVSDGYYGFLDLQGCLNYTVTPSKQGRCFSPPARDYVSLEADQDSQNFIGVPCPPSTDFEVTDFVSGSAGYPRVSANNAGSFVVGWHDDRLGPNHDVFAQRYVSIAQPVGSNFKVNDAGAAWNYDKPGVAITANGSFVLAWRDSRTDNQYKIYSQRYDSSSNSLGSNYRVDSDPTGTCRQPGIAIDASRKFTVVWYDRRNGKTDVFGQRYDSLGSPLGSNFVVNDVTTDDQDFASIGMNSSGSFVVCWLDNRSLSGLEVYCRRFNSAGTPLGASFKVNTIGPPSASTVREPDVTIDDAGNFVVVWQTSFHALPEDSFHIYAQRYNSSGSPIGSNFRVNDVGGSPATNQHYNPAVAMDGGGNFVIVWDDLRNGGRDIYGQEYNSSGSPIGSNFRVDDDTTNASQRDPDVSANGTYIYVTWIDGRGGGYNAIYAKVIPWTP